MVVSVSFCRGGVCGGVAVGVCFYWGGLCGCVAAGVIFCGIGLFGCKFPWRLGLWLCGSECAVCQLAVGLRY